MGCSSSNDAYNASHLAVRPPLSVSRKQSLENKTIKPTTELIKIEYFSIMGRADPLV